MSIFQKKHPNITLQLHPHAFHRLSEVKPGMTVICEDGLLLVTQTGNPQDYTLKEGQQMVIRGKGTVLIEAVSDSHVDILYPN
jgi:hypothetical protein